MEETIAYVGLDVHKKSISVAVAEGGRRGEARFLRDDPEQSGGPDQACREVVAQGRVASLLLRGQPLRLWGLSPSERDWATPARWWRPR